ncbi:hypothetical protein CDAR_426631 [Caerostris darwini]|uniref:Uncharacterized protein n=1 Tax=Caerostris darwini TaxID=1538125 RepID=A0AAV4N6F8_9ARAC|nr:hypothetical protein CDAR_426631 [Caerostris darwini]
MDANSDSVVHRISMINDENFILRCTYTKESESFVPRPHEKRTPTPHPRNRTSLEFTEMKFETRTQQKAVICSLFHKCKERNRCAFAILSRYSEVIFFQKNRNAPLQGLGFVFL